MFKRPGALSILVALAALSAAGCRFIDETTRGPVSAVRSVVPAGKPIVFEPAELQFEVQRYADQLATRSIASIDEYIRMMDTEEARSQGLRWKLGVSAASVNLAAGPNPIAGIVDLISVTAILRKVLEDRVKSPQGAAFEHWLATSRALEIEIWQLAERVLTFEQQEEIRQSVLKWMESNPDIQLGFFARPEEFSRVFRETTAQAAAGGGIISLLGLDPTAGLDPAVREVTRTRLFAERAMYTFQRLPFILRFQTEFLVDQITRRSDIRKALSDAAQLAESADRVSHATETVSRTVAELPERLRDEREAIVAALATHEGKLRDLSAQIERTLGAGDRMSTSLNTALVTFDALMKRFGVGEPKPDAAPDPDGKRFDILEYAKTAEQIEGAAKELAVLIRDANSTLDSPALDKRLQDLGAAAQRAKADARSILNHAALLGAGLIVLAFACALAFRRLAPRRAKTGATLEKRFN